MLACSDWLAFCRREAARCDGFADGLLFSSQSVTSSRFSLRCALAGRRVRAGPSSSVNLKRATLPDSPKSAV